MVADVAARGLRVEPLAHVALGAAGARGELLGAERAGAGHRLVQAELAAEADHHAAVAGGKVADGAHREGFELGLIDHGCVHGPFPFSNAERVIQCLHDPAAKPRRRQSWNRPKPVRSCHAGWLTFRSESRTMAGQVELQRIEHAARQPGGAARRGGVHAGRHLRRDERGRADGAGRRRRAAAVSRRDRRRGERRAATWPAACRSRCSARSTTIEASDIVIVPSVLLQPRGLAEGPLPAPGRLAAAHARARRDALLGLLGHLPAGRDRALRRQGRHRALRLRARLRGALSGGADPSGARAGDLRRARGTGQLGRLDDLARPGAVPHRAPRRRHHRAGGGAHVRAAMAPGRARRPTSSSKAGATTATARS